MGNEKYWEIKAKSSDLGEVWIYGEISSFKWSDSDVTPKDFQKELKSIESVKQLDIYINSGGGSVFAGQSIYSMLKRHKANKTVYVDGLAASIASVIAMAGDRIVMPKNAMMMIHNASMLGIGDYRDFRKYADDLEKINGSIISTYAEKTDMDITEIANLMDEETWMSADDAVRYGFADEIENTKKVAASIDGDFLICNNEKFDLSMYKNPPEIKNETDNTQTNDEPSEPGEPDSPGETNENRGESQPVSDNTQEINAQRTKMYELRRKINQIEED